MQTFIYTVTYYNCVDDTNETNTGLLCADTYGAATHKLIEFYGEEDILSLKIDYLFDSPYLILADKEEDKEMTELIIKHLKSKNEW